MDSSPNLRFMASDHEPDSGPRVKATLKRFKEMRFDSLHVPGNVNITLELQWRSTQRSETTLPNPGVAVTPALRPKCHSVLTRVIRANAADLRLAEREGRITARRINFRANQRIKQLPPDP